MRYRYNDWGQPEVFDDGLGAFRAMSEAEAAHHRIQQLAGAVGAGTASLNMGQTPTKFSDHRAPLTVRFKIVKACSKALEAAKVNDRSNREPILTAVYVDDRTYIKLLRELRGNANGVTMMPTDAEALEKGEWMGAPMYIVRRPCASYAEHIVATAEVLPTRRIG